MLHNQECYDEWYDGIIAHPEECAGSVDFYHLNFTPPFHENVHPQASTVTISNTQPDVDGIDFALDPLEPTAISNKVTNGPATFILEENFPNPFNACTSICLKISHTSEIDVSIYNILGQRAVSLLHGEIFAGTHRLIWDGSDEQGCYLPDGVYFCVLKSDGLYQDTIKLLLLK
jgi:hypothetical protein